MNDNPKSDFFNKMKNIMNNNIENQDKENYLKINKIKLDF